MARLTSGMSRGMTLLEIMMVVSLILILAGIAIPKLGGAIRGANERATRGKLVSTRSALRIYFADLLGTYPSDLTLFQQPGNRYLTGKLAIYTGDHGTTSNIEQSSTFDPNLDTGAIGYVNSGADWGKVWVQCTHTDTNGTTWTSY